MKMGKEVKIGLGVIGLLLVIFGYVAYRRLADSRPPEPLAAAPSEAPAEAGAGDASTGDAAADTSGSDDMLARMRKRPAEAAEKTPEPSWRRGAVEPTEHSHAGHERHEPKTPAVRTPHRDFSSANAFDTRPKTAKATEPEAEEEAEATASGEPRKLPDLEDVPAYARHRREKDETETEEEKPHEPSSRRPLADRTPERHHGEPAEHRAPPAALTIREASGPVRGVANNNNNDSFARPDQYSATPRSTPGHQPLGRPSAGAASHPGGDTPYAHGNEYNAAPHSHSSGATTKDYADSSKYGLKPGEQPHEPLPRGRGDQYVVQPNDSYWVIAARLYGSGGYFKALYEHNRGRYPWADKLKVGDKIAAPEVALLEREYPDLCPRPRSHAASAARQAFHPSARPVSTGRTYHVREGDTLFDIARYELGKANRWTEIYELNRERLGDDFDYLPPGTVLAMPGAHPAPHPSNEPYHAREPYDNDRVTGRPQPGPR